MGGDAHKNFSPSRLSNDQRQRIIDVLTSFFMDTGYFTSVTSPLPALEKHDHGDVDLAVVTVDKIPRFDEIMTDAGLFDRQGHSYLYNLDGTLHQVDVAVVPASRLDLELFFRSYGGLGDMLGHFAKYLGYKLSSKTGLMFRTALPISGTVKLYPVTADVREICEVYLGLDYDRLLQQFSTEKELFEWLRPVVPAYKNQSMNIRRQKPRPLQFRLCEWCETQTEELDVSHLSARPRLESLGRWEAIQAAYEEDVQRDADQRELKRVFNGATMTRYLEETHNLKLEGPRLGAFMALVRARLPPTPSQTEVYHHADAVFREQHGNWSAGSCD